MVLVWLCSDHIASLDISVEEQPVSVSVNMVAILYTYSDQQFCQDTSKTKTKRELEEEGRKKAPQTTHGVVSVPL